MDLKAILNDTPETPATTAPSPDTIFHHYVPSQQGVAYLGADAAAPASAAGAGAGATVSAPAAADPLPELGQRTGVQGKRADKPPIDPGTVPDGTGDRAWEARRDKQGQPKEGLHNFRVKKP